MVAVPGRRKSQKSLKEALDVDGHSQVFPADDFADALQSVVDHHRKVIGDPEIFARQNHIALQRRVGEDAAHIFACKVRFLERQG
jgi:hypothetical protein